MSEEKISDIVSQLEESKNITKQEREQLQYQLLNFANFKTETESYMEE